MAIANRHKGRKKEEKSSIRHHGHKTSNLCKHNPIYIIIYIILYLEKQKENQYFLLFFSQAIWLNCFLRSFIVGKILGRSQFSQNEQHQNKTSPST